jgi:predicted DsbA family dithiol-disulfide isomerase
MSTMTAVSIQIWSDYVCPFCMLAEQPLREATEGLDVAVEWMPFELRPHPAATLRPEDDYLPAIWKRAVYPMARRLGVDITLPTVSPQPYTRLAFEGYQYAAAHGHGEQYNSRVFQAFFQENRDIGRPEVLAELAAELGLDAVEFGAALKDGTYAGAHRRALRAAAANGVSAAPTILVGGVHRFEGVPNPVRLRQAVLDSRVLSDELVDAPLVCRIDGC